MAACEAAKEMQYLRMLISEMLKDLNLFGKGSGLTNKLLIDNQACLQIAKNPVNHGRTKHIEIRYHYLRDNVERGVLTTEYVPSTENLSDLFTKPLDTGVFTKHRDNLLKEAIRSSIKKNVEAKALMMTRNQKRIEEHKRQAEEKHNHEATREIGKESSSESEGEELIECDICYRWHTEDEYCSFRFQAWINWYFLKPESDRWYNMKSKRENDLIAKAIFISDQVMGRFWALRPDRRLPMLKDAWANKLFKWYHVDHDWNPPASPKKKDEEKEEEKQPIFMEQELKTSERRSKRQRRNRVIYSPM
jgi:hypothetical protein